MNRITWDEPDGSWGIKGAKLEIFPPKVFGAFYKLMDYEKTGLSPKQVVKMDLLYTEKCKEVAEMEKELKKQGKVCEPEYLGENVVIGCRDGRCNCGNLVRSYQNFCDNCGVKLEWDYVRS